MGVIRVNPPSIMQYASHANEIFATVRSTLDALVESAVAVNYKGPNAVEFKTKCGQLAVEFANALNHDVQRIAEAVSASTTAIADSLGGQHIQLDVNVTPIGMPSVPQGDGSVELDTGGLQAFGDSARSQFSNIEANLGEHLSALQATDWTGNAKDQAVSSVSTFTDHACSNVAATSTKMMNYVKEQVEATLRADQ